MINNLEYTRTYIEIGVEHEALPSPARSKRKSHATEGKRLHRP